jgi:hypothetical protein
MSYSIHFALRRDRKAKAMMPVIDGLDGARACAARMVAMAIGSRVQAQRAAERMALANERGDLRQEKSERYKVRYNRRQMRQSALWVRIFAGQVSEKDPRLEELSQIIYKELRLSWRASIWMNRWLHVQAMLFTPKLSLERRARIQRVLDICAARHDGLNPYGTTIAA